MAVVRPFHALRYNVERYPDLSTVLAPPYDIINANEQAALYARDPHNVIRLEYGQQSPADTESDNRYTRARATLDAWLEEQTLVMEGQPAFYPHQQRYAWAGQSYTRSGFFAAVELQPFDQGDVLPHEWTLKGPKVDRLQLMHTCLASFSPVFGLYDGRKSELGELLARASAAAPLATAIGHGFDETLWRTEDTGIRDAIATGLRERQILIADGHHRYETMLALRDMLRAEYPDAPATAAFNYVFMLLVDLNDPGLLVLPTHRLLLLTPEMRAAFSRIAGDNFRLEKINVPAPDAVTELLDAHRNEHAFVWYADGEYTLLTSAKTTRENLPIIDVVALQERIIAPLLALDPAGEATVERNVRYTVKPTDAVARVDSGEIAAALFLNPTPVDEVLTLAAHGIRMPQKSTYFYPKVPTGLVMHNLRPKVSVG
ncbi:MAG TPA: DUF1015 domain-containing protein [Armatimonadota bacterium]|jgi:uncharacterized protein (DUF1015 family)